jgi:hypothetical protein
MMHTHIRTHTRTHNHTTHHSLLAASIRVVDARDERRGQRRVGIDGCVALGMGEGGVCTSILKYTRAHAHKHNVTYRSCGGGLVALLHIVARVQFGQRHLCVRGECACERHSDRTIMTTQKQARSPATPLPTLLFSCDTTAASATALRFFFELCVHRRQHAHITPQHHTIVVTPTPTTLNSSLISAFRGATSSNAPSLTRCRTRSSSVRVICVWSLSTHAHATACAMRTQHTPCP